MSFPRRQDDRRRRVMMTSASATAANPSPGARARMEELREARRPTVAYGSRVRHCLRGRWFSLVPVQRKSLAKVFAWLLLVVLALVIANDATKRFVAIADRPQFVDVFQIARHGSIGRYFIGVMYLALAAAAWMVYQLRRFRNDDFSGNYRVWQWIVGLAFASSIATLVPVLAMLGGGVEWVIGRRIALSGQDWIGLFLIVGGAILAMRSVAEMWRYRGCLTLLISGWICTAIPIAVDWNILTTHTNLRWTIVTSAPLLAVSFWFAASVSYLRSLYREVRGVAPTVGILERFRAAIQERQAKWQTESEPAPAKAKRAPATATARARVTPPVNPHSEASDSEASDSKASDNEAGNNEAGGDENSKKSSAKSTTNPRRWFGLRGPAKPVTQSDSLAEKPASEAGATPTEAPSINEPTSDNEDTDALKKERRWWPRWRLTPKPQASEVKEESAAANDTLGTEADDSDRAPAKRRFGLGSMMKRKPANADEETSDAEQTTTASTRSNDDHSPRQNDESYDEDGDDEDSLMSDDDVDWSSLNKAERRKMRKQIKRTGRAA